MGITFFNPFKPKACVICGCKLLKPNLFKKNEISNHSVD